MEHKDLAANTCSVYSFIAMLAKKTIKNNLTRINSVLIHRSSFISLSFCQGHETAFVTNCYVQKKKHHIFDDF